MPVGAPDWGTIGIFGRVLAGPSYASGVQSVYRIRRLVTRSKFVLLSNASEYGIYSANDDLIPGASKTWYLNFDNNSLLFDHDDSTEASLLYTWPASSETDILLIDLGAVKDVFIWFKGYFYATNIFVKLKVSDDGTTWTEVYSDNTGSFSVALRATGRYIKLSVVNNTTSDTSVQLRVASLEAYPVNNNTKLNYYWVQTDTITAFVNEGGYWVYEVIYEVIPGWG